MDAGPPTDRRSVPAMLRLAPAFAAALLVAGGLLAYVLGKRSALPTRTAEDAGVSYASPFRNVRPDVKYVGDAACAQCHADHSTTYRQHPMGRSLAPLTRAAVDDRYDTAAGNPFEAHGYRFEVERRGAQVFHREIRTDAQGKPAATLEVEIDYVLGSGAHGKSYLVNRDGLLFQSPVSWLTDHRLGPFRRVSQRTSTSSASRRT